MGARGAEGQPKPRSAVSIALRSAAATLFLLAALAGTLFQVQVRSLTLLSATAVHVCDSALSARPESQVVTSGDGTSGVLLQFRQLPGTQWGRAGLAGASPQQPGRRRRLLDGDEESNKFRARGISSWGASSEKEHSATHISGRPGAIVASPFTLSCPPVTEREFTRTSRFYNAGSLPASEGRGSGGDSECRAGEHETRHQPLSTALTPEQPICFSFRDARIVAAAVDSPHDNASTRPAGSGVKIVVRSISSSSGPRRPSSPLPPPRRRRRGPRRRRRRRRAPAVRAAKLQGVPRRSPERRGEGEDHEVAQAGVREAGAPRSKSAEERGEKRARPLGCACGAQAASGLSGRVPVSFHCPRRNCSHLSPAVCMYRRCGAAAATTTARCWQPGRGTHSTYVLPAADVIHRDTRPAFALASRPPLLSSCAPIEPAHPCHPSHPPFPPTPTQMSVRDTLRWWSASSLEDLEADSQKAAAAFNAVEKVAEQAEARRCVMRCCFLARFRAFVFRA